MQRAYLFLFLARATFQETVQWLLLTRAVKGFFLRFKLAVWWTLINHGFHALAKRSFFPRFSSTRGTCRRLSRFCNILVQDLTPLHVNITRSTNLLSVCRRKLKFIIDLLTHCNLQPHKHSQYTLATCLSSC